MRYRRKRLSKRMNKKNFARTARRVHRKNLSGRVMRGGVRL